MSGHSKTVVFYSMCLAMLVKVLPGFSQNLASLSTNVIALADGATLNMDASYSLGVHWSIVAGFDYNPYRERDKERAFSLGTRYWLWYVYSGWWISAQAQYQEFSQMESILREGDRYGAGLSLGYSRMLSKHFNLDVGWGLWAGYEYYKVYGCQTCARIREKGESYFLMPDKIILSISYVF